MKDGKQQTGPDWTKVYYEAWNRRDWEWIGAMLAPDVEWLNAARDERIKGVNGVLSSFKSVVEGYPSARIDLRAVHTAGTVIVAECSIRSAPDAPTVRTATFCEILELKSGRCIRGTTYADSVRLLMDMSHDAAAA